MSESEGKYLTDEGEFLHEALDSVLTEVGLDLSNLVPQGCICCDVGAGAEISAFSSYNPKVFIASEPMNIQSESDEEKLKKVITAIPTVELIRQEPATTLSLLAERKIKVGLITWLKIFEDNKSDDFIDFFTQAQSLLIDNGVVVASVGIYGIDNEDGVGKDLMRAAFSVKELGFKVDLPDREKGSQSAGGVFLVATKLPNNNSPLVNK